MKLMRVKINIVIDLEESGWPADKIKSARDSLLSCNSFSDMIGTGVFQSQYEDSIEKIEVEIEGEA